MFGLGLVQRELLDTMVILCLLSSRRIVGIVSHLFKGNSYFWSRQYSFDPNRKVLVINFNMDLVVESIPNRTAELTSDTTLSKFIGIIYPSDAEAVYTNVTLTVVDEGLSFQDIQFKGQFSNWNFAQGYDDGTNGDEIANDGIWTAVIDSVVGPNSYRMGCCRMRQYML